MSAAPRPVHQRVNTRLSYFLEGFLENTDIGTAYVAPKDVILPDKLGNPVQPEFVVVHRESLHIIEELDFRGTPDLAIEVLSPSNPSHDRNLKYGLYAEVGVQEYWIIDPHIRTIEVHVLRGGSYVQQGRRREGEATLSTVLDGVSVPVDEIIPT